MRRHRQLKSPVHNRCIAGCLDERMWVLGLLGLVLLLCTVQIVLVVSSSQFEYGDGSGLKSRVLYNELDTLFTVVSSGVCETNGAFDQAFTSIELTAGTIPGVEWFVFIVAGINMLYSIGLIYLAAISSYGLEDLPNQSRQVYLRRFMLLLAFPLFLSILSGTLIQLGIDFTCEALPEDGCYLECCVCPQVFCDLALTQVCSSEAATFPQTSTSFNDNRFMLETAVITSFIIASLEALILVLLGFLYNKALSHERSKRLEMRKLRDEQLRKLILT